VACTDGIGAGGRQRRGRGLHRAIAPGRRRSGH
jgi:hypothetical protein